jgi:hypothetical protein
MDKGSLDEKFAAIAEHWSPRIEPAGTRNTGNLVNERTLAELGRV